MGLNGRAILLWQREKYACACLPCQRRITLLFSYPHISLSNFFKLDISWSSCLMSPGSLYRTHLVYRTFDGICWRKWICFQTIPLGFLPLLFTGVMVKKLAPSLSLSLSLPFLVPWICSLLRWGGIETLFRHVVRNLILGFCFRRSTIHNNTHHRSSTRACAIEIEKPR